MFKVFIADDEQYIIDGLKIGVPWGDFGFAVCGSAGDGRSALAEIERLRPDVVFTDIKMPCLNGLELIARVRAQFPEILIVIISGYAEFEYAKTAISHGVDGYTLKPIEVDEIIEHLKKFNENLNRRLREEKSSVLMAAIENDDMTAFKKCFSGTRAQYILSSGGKLSALEGRHETVVCRVARNQWLYVSPEAYGPESLAKMAAGEVAGLGAVMFNDAEGSVSACVAEALLRSYGYFMNPQMTIRTSGFDVQAVRRYHFLLGCLLQQVHLKDATAAGETLQSMSLLLKDISIAELSKSCIMLEAIKSTEHYEDEPATGMGFQALAEKWQDARACFDDFQKGIREVLFPRTGYKPVYSGNRLVTEALSYLQGHFKENPALTGLAERFHVNPVHLSRLFKKETGLTPLEYLTQIKMEKACALLAKTNLSINDVAQETGYEDYLYFRKVFKKYCGETPTTYRSNKLHAAKE